MRVNIFEMSILIIDFNDPCVRPTISRNRRLQRDVERDQDDPRDVQDDAHHDARNGHLHDGF